MISLRQPCSVLQLEFRSRGGEGACKIDPLGSAHWEDCMPWGSWCQVAQRARESKTWGPGVLASKLCLARPCVEAVRLPVCAEPASLRESARLPVLFESRERNNCLAS